MDLWRGAARRILDFSQRRPSDDDYELLAAEPSGRTSPPTTPNGYHHSTHHHHKARRRPMRVFLHFCTLRRACLFAGLIPILVVIGILWSGIPPSYKDVREYERRLPQHNLSLPFPEGETGMYIRFPGHLWGHGLNNILQETLLMSYLAYASNRSFVFEDYVWSRTPLPYTVYDFALRPARIPLNAFISGPTAGGPMPAPRAISAKHWEVVCPPKKRTVVSSKDQPADVDGDAIVRWWVDRLEGAGGCVEVDSSEVVVFDRFLFGGPRILPLYPELAASPILSSFTWSPLVHSAVARNFALLQPRAPRVLLDLAAPSTLDGLVAVHLRRGDYKRHCPRLEEWDSRYMGLNQHASLPDRFDPAPLRNNGASKQGLLDYYLEHCLPSHEQIADRLRALRDENPGLRRVYVLTNGWGWWVNGLKDLLVKDGWDDLRSSLDLVLDGEGEYVAMAVDMAIAEKAEVFVGNGFSSLSSNIVMFRMAKGLDARSNRFL